MFRLLRLVLEGTRCPAAAFLVDETHVPVAASQKPGVNVWLQLLRPILADGHGRWPSRDAMRKRPDAHHGSEVAGRAIMGSPSA